MGRVTTDDFTVHPHLCTTDCLRTVSDLRMIDSAIRLFWMIWFGRYGLPPDFILAYAMTTRHLGSQFVYNRIRRVQQR